MTFKDLFAYAFGNLWRMKLRSSLTIAGVVIGVGMMISMLSFGIGMYGNIHDRFEKLGLFTTILVLPSPEPSRGAEGEALKEKRLLNEDTVREIEAVPGVSRVMPFEIFTARVEHDGRSKSLSVQALPAKATTWKGFSNLCAGRFFNNDSAMEAVIRKDIIDALGFDDPADIVGREITLVTAKNSIVDLVNTANRFRKAPLSFLNPVTVIKEMTRLFATLDELEKSPFKEMRYPLTVTGVIHRTTHNFEIRPLLIPIGTAGNMDRLGFSNIFDLMAQGKKGEGRTDRYTTLMVNAETIDDVSHVSAALTARDFHTLSFAENFEEIQKGMLLFDLFVAAIAMVAVIVAALGIVNTLIMSIMERTREIGILKSLGAEERHIRLIFLTEAGLIGIFGAIGGDLLGWIVARICSFIGQQVMIYQNVPPMDAFSTPIWLVCLGVVFGIGISVAAGLYPAHRAARVDPITALRYD